MYISFLLAKGFLNFPLFSLSEPLTTLGLAFFIIIIEKAADALQGRLRS